MLGRMDKQKSKKQKTFSKKIQKKKNIGWAKATTVLSV
jgi:hypothetical protein